LGALAGIAGNVLGLKTSSDLFIGVLQSRTVQDDLINKFNLRSVYWDKQMADARKDLSRRTDITADRKSGIITIVVTDHDPHRAAAMGHEYVEQLDTLLVRLNTSAAHRERIFLEERLAEVTKDLESSEKSLSSFSSKNATLDIKEQSAAMVDAAAMLEGQLVAAQTELGALKQIYGDGNVRVRASQARIDELKRQIQKIGGKSEASDSADQYVDSLYPTLRALPLIGVKYADLYREVKVQEATFAMLTREYEMAKVEEAKELPSVRVLDEPEVPTKRSFPPRLLLVAMGAVLAMVAAAVVILVTERWKSIDPDDPGKLLAVDVWLQMSRHANGAPIKRKRSELSDRIGSG
jgi:capsule polysaccharide export protein KpsE/RkpR